MCGEFSDEVWRAAMDQHGHEIAACHELVTDVDGLPHGVTRYPVTGFVVGKADMQQIADKMRTNDD